MYTLKDVYVEQESAKALLVTFQNKVGNILVPTKVWLPKSQIKSTTPPCGERGDISVTDWLAIQKGWLEVPDQEDPWSGDNWLEDLYYDIHNN